MSYSLRDRFHPRLRRQLQAAIDAGRIRKIEETAYLEESQLLPLAYLSLQLLLVGALFFGLLNYIVYVAQYHTFAPHVALASVLLWLLASVVGYFLMLPLHELLHALAFLLWGGTPYFGVKWPYALYCGARDQLFCRNQYLVVGLAPLVVITLAGIILTVLAPTIAVYTLAITVGNISGAAGDVLAAQHLWRMSPDVLVEDTNDGFRVWEITGDAIHLDIRAKE
jgi:hypothetical protein